MNYFPFHVGDYAAHTAHLEPMEDLAYRRMLDLYYLREAALPCDPAEVARLIRMRANVAEVTSVLREFFAETDAGWVSERCDEEIAKMQDRQAKAKASAAASVSARKTKANQAANERTANVERTLNERSTYVELPTPTPTPTPIYSVPIGTGGKPPITDPDEIIFGYGLPMLTNAGTPEKQARSFLGGLRKHHGDAALINKLRECAKAKPLQPLEWLAAALPPAGVAPKLNSQEALEASNRAIAERFLAEEAAHEAV